MSLVVGQASVMPPNSNIEGAAVDSAGMQYKTLQFAGTLEVSSSRMLGSGQGHQHFVFHKPLAAALQRLVCDQIYNLIESSSVAATDQA